MAGIVRDAPAKLNLTLEIVGRRPDGYHLLDSLVAFTEYGDTIEAEPAETLSLRVTGPFGDVLSMESGDNLVLRAARLLARATETRQGAALTLVKRLPVASGIGGGSSDAAATLSALTDLWRIDPPAGLLRALALDLGADVPVCLAGHPARLQGIGEHVTPIPPLPPCPILLVNPGIGLATPAVFKARRGGFSAGSGAAGVLRDCPVDTADLAHRLAPHGNDLAEAAIGLLPIIGDVLARIAAAAGCLLARMSGSGATCFGIFETDAAAEAALATLDPAWWAVATRLRPAD
jgi:4-diphosphocytidyl-2-C-methyl-D-erythritol kinase